MTDLVVHPHEHALSSPIAVTLAMRGWLEIQDKGYGDGVVPDMSKHLTILATEDQSGDHVPAGVLLWSQGDDGSIFVTIAHVVEEFRGKGIFKTMLSRLIDVAGSVNAPKIHLGVSKRNSAMLRVAEKTGFAEEAVLCTLNLR